MREIIKNFFKDLFDLLYPPKGECGFCGLPAEDSLGCGGCLELFHKYRKQEFCRKCGKFIYKENLGLLCFDCSNELPVFSFARAAGLYEGVVKDALYSLKYTGRRSLAAPMGQLMARSVVEDGRYRSLEVIVPVPLAEGRLRRRGFNQSGLLARELGKWLKVRVEEALVRTKDTDSQAKKGRRERLYNLQGAFAMAFGQDLTGKRVLLVDDVLTTGTTLNQCTKVLMDHGVTEVMAVIWAAGQDICEETTEGESLEGRI